VRITIRTAACPAGQGADAESIDRALLDRPFEVQLREVKRIVRQYLARIDEACGRTHSPALLGRQFDEQFRDLAGRYWLDLPVADRRQRL
jgi:hypothetical protein